MTDSRVKRRVDRMPLAPPEAPMISATIKFEASASCTHPEGASVHLRHGDFRVPPAKGPFNRRRAPIKLHDSTWSGPPAHAHPSTGTKFLPKYPSIQDFTQVFHMR